MGCLSVLCWSEMDEADRISQSLVSDQWCDTHAYPHRPWGKVTEATTRCRQAGLSHQRSQLSAWWPERGCYQTVTTDLSSPTLCADSITFWQHIRRPTRFSSRANQTFALHIPQNIPVPELFQDRDTPPPPAPPPYLLNQTGCKLHTKESLCYDLRWC